MKTTNEIISPNRRKLIEIFFWLLKRSFFIADTSSMIQHCSVQAEILGMGRVSAVSFWPRISPAGAEPFYAAGCHHDWRAWCSSLSAAVPVWCHWKPGWTRKRGGWQGEAKRHQDHLPEAEGGRAGEQRRERWSPTGTYAWSHQPFHHPHFLLQVQKRLWESYFPPL